MTRMQRDVITGFLLLLSRPENHRSPLEIFFHCRTRLARFAAAERRRFQRANISDCANLFRRGARREGKKKRRETQTDYTTLHSFGVSSLRTVKLIKERKKERKKEREGANFLEIVNKIEKGMFYLLETKKKKKITKILNRKM